MLRLLDRWIQDGPAIVASADLVAPVMRAIDAVPPTTPIRSLLRGIVDTMRAQGTVALTPQALAPVSGRLMAYAQALEYDAQWRLAVDVYQTLLALADPVTAADLVVPATLRLATCWRQLDELAASDAACTHAASIAAGAGDREGELLAQIGTAKVVAARGNLPEATRRLGEIITAATAAGLARVEARARHDRAAVALARGEYVAAIRDAYDAFAATPASRDRDRLLGDIAGAFMMLGQLAVARDAYVVLTATAQEQYVRWTSMINLLGIAAREGQALEFDRLRHDLAAAPFPPHLQAAYLIQVGEGSLALGRTAAAVSSLEQALSFAAAHHLNQRTIQAETLLCDARRATIAAATAATPSGRSATPVPAPPRAVQDVATAIHVMRMQVSV